MVEYKPRIDTTDPITAELFEDWRAKVNEIGEQPGFDKGTKDALIGEQIILEYMIDARAAELGRMAAQNSKQ